MFGKRALFLTIALAVVLLQFASAAVVVHGGSAAAPAQTVTVFDFTSNTCSAVWWSGAGQLPCPLADGDPRGYVLKVDHPVLETGVTDTAAGLVVGPQNKTNGYLQGFYPDYTVQPGDHFQASVGCANGSACYVTYRLDYRINGGAINILWTWKEANEGRIFQLDKDLTSLAGKKVSFILTLLATGPATGDRAIWGQPRIVGAGVASPTPTPSATTNGPTSTGPTATVPASTPPPGTVFDFSADICSAKWWSGAGQLACPMADGAANGYAVKVNNPLLEDGTTDSLPGLIIGPQNKTDGYLQGFYPDYTVQPGDHFQTIVGCAHGSSCFVTYRLDYRINGGAINILWKWKEANEGRTFNEDFDLSALAGKKVSFILTMLATGSPVGDRAIWGHPRIVGAGAPPPTATPNGFLTYTNTANGFKFNYPADAALSNVTDNSVHMALSIVPGTNLSEKFLDAGAVQTGGACSSGMQGGTQSQVTINGIPFLKEVGEDGGAGQFHDWTAYSTARGSTCVTLTFVLHWSPANNFDPPKPEFDRTAESAVFDQMISSFAWLTQQPAGTVTNVTVAANPIFSACGGPNVVDFSGTITTDGAANVTYHWEVGGDATAGTPDQQLAFGGAGTQAINTDAFKANCGSYVVRLVVTAPNSVSAQANFSIGPQTATPTPQSATPTSTSTPIPPTATSVPPTSVPPPGGTAFDFTSNICAAKWWSGAGQLPCPMADGASTGYAVVVNNPLLENGTSDSLPGLVVGPQNKTDGYIQGFYPDYTVQPGDHFQASVGCANGSSCFVTYRLDYRINGGAINILWKWKEANDNQIFNEDFDLSALAGKKVSIILTLLATGSASGDRAIWGHPRIVHSGAGTPTATVTGTPPVSSLRVGYIKSGNVWLWTDVSAPRQLTSSGGDSSVKLSDDSQVAAFLRGDELWAVNTDGTNARRLVSAAYLGGLPGGSVRIFSMAFVPHTHTLFFTTGIQGEAFFSASYDLQAVDADSPVPVQYAAANQGGLPVFSPFGDRALLLTNQSVNLINVNGGGLRHVYGFPIVSTYSEWSYIPQVAWGGGDSFYIVVPPSDALSNPSETTKVNSVSLDGGSSQLAEFLAAPISSSQPQFARDGLLIVYMRQAGDNLELHMTDITGADGVYETFPSGGVIGWAPSATFFVFWKDDVRNLYLGHSGSPSKPLTDVAHATGLRWVDADRYVFVSDGQLRSGSGPYLEGGSSRLIDSGIGGGDYDFDN